MSIVLPLSYSDCCAVVTNVLQGRTADNSAPFKTPIPFTANPAARTAASFVLTAVCNRCRTVLTPDDITPLAGKLLHYLSITGKQDPKDIFGIPIHALTDSILADPSLIRGIAGIPAILRKHQQGIKREVAKKWLNFPQEVPPRTNLWSRHPFTLEEATDPRHLIHDSHVLGHCVGTSFNSQALAIRGLTPNDPGATHFLHYWLKIKDGNSRILTLMSYGVPQLTIDFAARSRVILYFEGKRHTRPPRRIMRIAYDALTAALPVRDDDPMLTALKNS